MNLLQIIGVVLATIVVYSAIEFLIVKAILKRRGIRI